MYNLYIYTKTYIRHRHHINATEANKHFNNNEHTFSKSGKFIIYEQLQNINTTRTETLNGRLRERKNFRIKKLKKNWHQFKPTTDTMYAVPVIFTLLSLSCIWTKTLTYISQLTSNNQISCCRSLLQLCPLKAATAETCWESYRFY